MTIETWYLTPEGWRCGTVSDAGVEAFVPPPPEHAAIVQVMWGSPRAGESATFQRLSRDEQRAPALEEKFGPLPRNPDTPIPAATPAPEKTSGAPQLRGGSLCWLSLLVLFAVGVVSEELGGSWMLLGFIMLALPVGVPTFLAAVIGARRAFRARAWPHLVAGVISLLLNGLWLLAVAVGAASDFQGWGGYRT